MALYCPADGYVRISSGTANPKLNLKNSSGLKAFARYCLRQKASALSRQITNLVTHQVSEDEETCLYHNIFDTEIDNFADRRRFKIVFATHERLLIMTSFIKLQEFI